MKKVKLCLFSQRVEVIADYFNNEQYALAAMKLHNDKIMKENGNLRQDFWFITMRVKKQVHVIANSSYTQFAPNDPQFTKRLEIFIAEETNSRSKRYDP